MQCPSCEEKVELTWARYLTTLSGTFKCPKCSAQFRLIHPWYYWFMPTLLLAVILIGGLAINIIVAINQEYELLKWPAISSMIILLTWGYMSIDKRVENGMRVRAR